MARSTARTQAGAANRTPSRTLADQLRGWPDDRLSRLLRDRPDLATPAPQDSGQLASRAAARSSVPRALDLLTRAELCVVDALVAAGQTTQADLVAVVNAAPASVVAAVERLVDLALAWESTGGLRAVGGVADLGRGVAQSVGLGGLRPFSPEPPAREEVEARLAELSPPARALLEHVDESGGEATAGSARHTVLPEDAATPAEELLARRLLVPRPGGQVWVPGEVSVALRGGHTTRERVDVVPTLATTERRRRRGRTHRGGGGVRGRTPPRAAPRPLGLPPAGRAPGRRPGRARAQGRGPPPARGRADDRAARRGRGRGQAGRGALRRRRQRRLRADRRVRRVDPSPDRRALGGAGDGLARHAAAAGPGRHARRRRQGPLRAVAGEHQRLRRRDPQDDSRAGRSAAGRPGTGGRHRSRLARRAVVVAAAPAAAHARRAGGLGAGRGERLGPGRPRRDAGVRAGAARRRGRRRTAGAVAARARRPRAAAGRPDRGRARPARARPRPAAAGGGRGGVARRRDGLPLHRPIRTPRTRRRLDLRRAARLRRGRLAHAGAAAAQLPDRRHRPHLRHRPGRPRGGVRPGRRRGGAHRAPRSTRRPARSGCGGWPRPC